VEKLLLVLMNHELLNYLELKPNTESQKAPWGLFLCYSQHIVLVVKLDITAPS